jgi:hypothetical protein
VLPGQHPKGGVMARLIRGRLENRKGASHFAEYFFLLAFGGAFVMMSSGYVSRHLAGGLIDFSGVLLGKPSRASASAGGSTSKSSSVSADQEHTVGSQQARFWGDSSSQWGSSSGFTLATDNPNGVKAGGYPTVDMIDTSSNIQ